MSNNYETDYAEYWQGYDEEGMTVDELQKELAKLVVDKGMVDFLPINSDELADLAVTAEKLAEDSVGSNAIQNLAIKEAHIAEAAVGTAAIQEASITTLLVQDAAITSAKIGNAAVKNIHIDDAAIDNAAIQNLAVSTAKIDDLAVTEAKISDLAVTTAKIEDAAITNAKIQNAAVDTAQIADAAITNAKIDRASVNRLIVESADIEDAAIISAKIDDLAVTSAKIDTAAVTNIKIQDAAVTTAKIKTGSITNALIDNAAVDTAQLADASITDAKIVELSAGKIQSGSLDTGLVTIQDTDGHLVLSGSRMQVFDDQAVPVERVSVGDVLGDGTRYGLLVRSADGVTVLYDEQGVYEAGITDGAVTNPKIGSGAVKNENIFASTITGDRLVVDAITAREIATDTITANSGIIANAAIGTAEIADLAVVTAKIGDAQISTAKIEDAAITNAKIKNAEITDAKILNLDGRKIDADSITTDKLIVGDTENLCPEPNFRYDGIEWGGAVEVAVGGPNAPTDSVGMQTARDGYGSDWFDVIPGQKFYVSASAFTNGSTHQWGVGIQFQNRDGQSNWPVQRLNPASTWTQVSGTVTAPNDAVRGRVFTQINSIDTFGTWYFTHVEIRKMIDTPLVVNGAIRSDHINVNSLEAISANLGTVTAGKLTANTTIDVGTDLKVGQNIYLDAAATFDSHDIYGGNVHLIGSGSSDVNKYVNIGDANWDSIIAGSKMIVTANSTSFDKGIAIGQNTFDNPYVAIDGANDLVVNGMMAVSGPGGASMYKLGIGTGPPSGEGDLTVAGLTTLRPPVASPWGLYLDMRWNNPGTYGFLIEMDGDGTDDIFVDYRSNVDGDVAGGGGNSKYRVYSNGEVHASHWIYSQDGDSGRFAFDDRNYLKVYNAGGGTEGAQIVAGGATKQTWTSLPKSRVDPAGYFDPERSFGVNNPGSMQPALMDFRMISGGGLVELDERFEDFVGSYEVFVNNGGKVTNKQADYFEVEGEGPMMCIIIGIEQGKEYVSGYKMLSEEERDKLNSIDGVLSTKRKIKGSSLDFINKPTLTV